MAPRSRPITLNGKTKSLIDWARELGVSAGTLSHRLRSGMSIERALTPGNMPIRHFITFNGETKPLVDWARTIGVSATVLHHRLKKMPIERALSHHGTHRPYELRSAKMRESMPGRRFGRLIVLRSDGRLANGMMRWFCHCDCGKEFSTREHSLLCGRTRSCGCEAHGHARHGATCGGKHTPEWIAWIGMQKRCYERNSPAWDYYGGRGIRVCDRWLGTDGFVHFLADMGPRPSPKHTIDRIDNDGDYEPGNCRWATKKEQAQNMRSNRYLNIHGKMVILADCGRELGFQKYIVPNRLHRGWTEEEAINTPLRVPPPYVPIDLTGRRFGRLVVLGLNDPSDMGHQRHKTPWRVRCDCGTEKVVPGAYFLKKTVIRSCGCMRRGPRPKNRE